MLKLMSLGLQIQADTTSIFANVAASMAGQIAAIAEMARTVYIGTGSVSQIHSTLKSRFNPKLLHD
jgi:glucokinase